MSKKILTENKHGLFNYEIMEKWQAGLKLTGPEVKSVKAGQIDLKGAYISLKNRTQNGKPEAWLINTHISAYKKAGYANQGYQPTRSRKLLLNQRELNYLSGKIKQKGLTILPILVYTFQRLVKIEIGLARGKNKHDKRETIKKREFDLRKTRLIQK